MFHCQHCGRDVEAAGSARDTLTCPHCGHELVELPDRGLTDVARVVNLAEAGFLAEILAGDGIDAQIHAVESFSGTAGSWSVAYLVRVPSELAERAAERIRRYVAEGEAARDEPADWSPFEAATRTGETFRWPSVAMMMLAGVVGFILGQQFASLDARPRPQPGNGFPAAVGEIGRPLLTEPAAGQPRHRLSYERAQRVWHLDTDRDGDGEYDQRRAFPAPARGG